MRHIRDIIKEIDDIRQRRQFDSPMLELTNRLFSLESAFKASVNLDAEFIRYFPVALIACIENYFRLVIRDLIDAGEPYLSNAKKTASSIKLDFAILQAVHGKVVTVGELIANGVQLSRIDRLQSVMTDLIGVNFLDKLQTTTDRWGHEIAGKPATPILTNADQVFADVARTFELRHIICHEIASAYDINASEVARCFNSCVAFLKASDELVSETLHPGAPLTQTDMNIAAGQSLAKAQSELSAAAERVTRRLSKDELYAFNKAQENWQSYSDAWVDFVAGDRAGGGTIWSLVAARTAEATVRKRIEELTSWKRLSDLS